MNLTKEDKILIVARNFFEENKGKDGAFDSFDQAIAEIKTLPEKMIEMSIGFLKPNGGNYRPMMKDGCVIDYNQEDGHVLPLNEQPEELGKELYADFLEISSAHPEIESHYVLLQKLGWKLL